MASRPRGESLSTFAGVAYGVVKCQMDSRCCTCLSIITAQRGGRRGSETADHTCAWGLRHSAVRVRWIRYGRSACQEQALRVRDVPFRHVLLHGSGCVCTCRTMEAVKGLGLSEGAATGLLEACKDAVLNSTLHPFAGRMSRGAAAGGNRNSHGRRRHPSRSSQGRAKRNRRGKGVR